MSAGVQNELRRMAIHEAGHAVAFEALHGLNATVEIWIDRASRLQGRCTHGQVLSTLARAAVALAGGAAEVIASKVTHPTDRSLLEAVRLHASAVDIANAGAFGDRELRTAHGLCLMHWDEIVARAQREIEIFNRRAAVVEALATAY